MERVTFIESIIKILNLIASVPFFIEILILSFVLLIAMIFFYFRKSKKGKITSLIIYIVTLFLLPISHFSFFANTLDKIVENYIEILYFPSCYVYIALLIITDISVLKSVVKNVKSQQRKWYDLLDLVYFFIFQFLFFMIITTVIKENIDIFERSQLYSDVSLTSLLQISSYLFWIRIGIKLIVFIVNRLSKDGPNVPNLQEKSKKSSYKNDLSVESVAQNINNNVNKAVGLNDKNFVVNDFSIKQSGQRNSALNNVVTSLEDFPVNREFEKNPVSETNKNVGISSMDTTSFITGIDNNKHKLVKLTDDDLVKSTPNDSIKNNQSFWQNKNIKKMGETSIGNVDINLELNDQEENDDFFDDFYE